MKKLTKMFFLLLSIAGIVCGIICAVQFAMAIRYGELGRVVVYFMLAALSVELFFIALTRLLAMRKRKKEQS